jgi:hypothetical protein
MSNELNEPLRRLVAGRAGHLCEYCLVHEDDLYHGCEVDHIISLKHGGATTIENLAYACFHCNRHKGTDLGSLSLHSGVLVRFFNPRTDPWGQHFFQNSGRIESLTEIAEITARLLDFNHPERVAFRKLLAEGGRYPSIEALARMR